MDCTGNGRVKQTGSEQSSSFKVRVGAVVAACVPICSPDSSCPSISDCIGPGVRGDVIHCVGQCDGAPNICGEANSQLSTVLCRLH